MSDKPCSDYTRTRNSWTLNRNFLRGNLISKVKSKTNVAATTLFSLKVNTYIYWNLIAINYISWTAHMVNEDDWWHISRSSNLLFVPYPDKTNRHPKTSSSLSKPRSSFSYIFYIWTYWNRLGSDRSPAVDTGASSWYRKRWTFVGSSSPGNTHKGPSLIIGLITGC